MKTFYVFIALWVAFCVYAGRYEFGLAKPKFHKGDCVRQNLSDEFNATYEYRIILEVGKKEYNTLWYQIIDGKAMALNYTIGYHFKYLDQQYEKTDCPKQIGVY